VCMCAREQERERNRRRRQSCRCWRPSSPPTHSPHKTARQMGPPTTWSPKTRARLDLYESRTSHERVTNKSQRKHSTRKTARQTGLPTTWSPETPARLELHESRTSHERVTMMQNSATNAPPNDIVTRNTGPARVT